MTTSTKLTPGTVRTWDVQSDIYRGQYRLIEEVSPGVWEAERLAPGEAEIEAIIEQAERYVESGGKPWCLGHGGTDDPWEAAEQEISEREESAGERFRLRIVSSEEWHAAF